MKRVIIKKDFGDLLTDAWDEYKKNFKTFFIIILLLSVIPAIIIQLITNASPNAGFIVSIFVILLSILMGASLIFMVFSKKKLDYKQAIKGGASYFWKYLGLSIIMAIFLAILFILLIIPGIIFWVSWIFAAYILIAEKKPIMASLKSSRYLVRGRWWRVFGYSILFAIIVIIILIVFQIPAAITLSPLIQMIGTQIALIIVVPLATLFYRNFYQELVKHPAGKKK